MQQPQHDLRSLQAPVASPRRFVSVGVVALLHVIVIYALASGLAAQLVDKIPQDIKADIIKDKPPDMPKAPPPPPPDLVKPPPPFIPPPDIVIANDAPTNTITAVTNVVQPPAPPKPAGVTAPALLANRGNNCAASYYPPLAVRLNHEGSVTVAVHVGADGSVQNVDIQDPGQYPELAPASVRCVTEKYHFQPGMQNGVAVPAIKLMRITWKLAG